MTLSRRDFIKAQAASAAATVAGISLPAAAAQEGGTDAKVRWDKAPCRFCGTGCGVLVGTRNGRVVATQGDPDLKQYDALILDEAHERSLNIDFLLGYLKRLLERRKDLKLVISSATLDAGSFAAFFNGAPVLQAEGRTFGVEEFFLPPDEEEELTRHVPRAVDWLTDVDPMGDVLVFLPGEREIRDCADALDGRKYRNTEVLPLFARLGLGDQQRIFSPGSKRRRAAPLP